MVRFEHLTRRLVLATPQAYKKLTDNLSLLIRLNDHLGMTDKINVELLEAYGFKVYLLPGQRAFGLSLPSRADKLRYDEALDQLVEMPGQVAVDLFQQMGIKIIGGENLTNTERTLALHRIIQFAIADNQYTETGVIIIDSYINTAEIIQYKDISNGKKVFLIPTLLLDGLERPELLQVSGPAAIYWS